MCNLTLILQKYTAKEKRERNMLIMVICGWWDSRWFLYSFMEL